MESVESAALGWVIFDEVCPCCEGDDWLMWEEQVVKAEKGQASDSWYLYCGGCGKPLSVA